MNSLFGQLRSLTLLLTLCLASCGEEPSSSDSSKVSSSVEESSVLKQPLLSTSSSATTGLSQTEANTSLATADANAPIMIAASRDEEEIPLSILNSQAAPPTALPSSESGSRPLTNEEQKVVLDRILAESAQRQAEGLGNGSVKVNAAWPYTGYSILAPNPKAAIEARLVAVDITISGHTPWFDMDDIEIADGAVEVSYGSDPQIEPLQADGSLMPDDGEIPVAPLASRWLLIYAYPKASPSFRLYYWGKNLTPTPITFGESRLSLPYPPTEPESSETASPAQ